MENTTKIFCASKIIYLFLSYKQIYTPKNKIMKKKILILMLLCFTFMSCDLESDRRIIHRIEPNNLSLFVGMEYDLKYSGGKCKWSSENDNIVSVDANGNVRAEHVGYTTIRANEAECKINVSSAKNCYKEPILRWGASLSSIKNSEYSTLVQSNASALLYENRYISEYNKVKYYIYAFESSKLKSSFMAIPIDCAGELADFLLDRYIPQSIDSNDYTATFISPDGKTYVMLMLETLNGEPLCVVGYAPYETTKSSIVTYKEKFRELMMNIK